MKIGFDAKRIFRNNRGLGHYSRTIVKGLTTYYPEHEYLLFGADLARYPFHKWVAQELGELPVIQPRNPSKISQALWRSSGMRKDIVRNELDIYHGLSHEIPRGKKDGKTRYVVTIHDLIFLRFPQYFSRIDIQIYLRKMKYSCLHADLVIAISEQTKADLIYFLHIPEEKIVVHYQSCSPIYSEPVSNADLQSIKQKYELPEQYYLFVGALVQHKNLQNVLYAMRRLPEAYRYPLIVIGRDGGYEKQIRQLVQQLELTHQVHFIDKYVPSEDMPALYQLAKLFLWPSLYEGFGIPIIEALFSKLPVVTSKNGCFEEVGGPASVYVDPNKPEEIADAIEVILSDKHKYRRMQDEGYQFADRFRLENSTRKLMDIYQSIL